MVVAGVQDLTGNTMTGSVTTSFTTGDFIDTLKLNVQVLESVDPTVPFRLVFNKPVGPPQSARRPSRWSECPIPAAMDITYPSGTVTQNGNTFLFTPALPLQVSTTYQLNMGAVTDLSGNVSTPVNRTFTTAGTSAYDYTSLTIVSTSPANGDVGIPINNPIAVTFNKAVDPTTVSTATFGITTTGFPMLGSFSVSGNVVTFTPSQPWPAASSVRFQPGLGYYGAVQDLYGNKLESFTSYSFKTAAPTDTTPPQLTALIRRRGRRWFRRSRCSA
jgi:hypothetical protein